MNLKRWLAGKSVTQRVLLVALVLAVALGWTGFRAANRYGQAVHTGSGHVTFRLVTIGGNDTVTEGDFRGNWTLVWFLDAECPEPVCVPTLRAIDRGTRDLAAAHIPVAALAITLDPVHDQYDTERQIDPFGTYVLDAAPTIRAMTGAPRAVESLAGVLHVPMETAHTQAGAPYHRPAAHIAVLDPHGRHAGDIDAGAGPDAIEAFVRAHAAR